MNSGGNTITETMNQIQELAQNIDKLLGETNTLMAKDGWTPISSTCTATSRTPGNANWWFPSSFFQFYKHEAPAYSHLLPFCAVVLLARSGKLEQPMSTSGCFNYGSGNSVNNKYFAEWAEVHLWTPDPALDGKFRTTPKESLKPKPSISFLDVKSLALPLVKITDAASLKGSLIDPTLKMIEKYLKGDH